MGLSLYLEHEKCPTCGHAEERDSFDYTYNVSPMWRQIYPDDEGMVFIDGMTGKEAFEKLIHALDYMKQHKEELEALNPSNGWGSYEGFMEFIRELIHACIETPDAIWTSWR